MAAAKQQATIVGVFDDRVQADKALDALIKAGFRQDQIGVAMRSDEREIASTGSPGEESQATTGALAGAVTGLGLGALAGLGVLAGVIPVVGPAITAGTLGVILTNAAAGAGIAGLIGTLIGAGIPEHEARYYDEEFQAGRTIVTVSADGRAAEASSILRQYGAYDMSTRGSAASSSSAGPAGASRPASTYAEGRETTTTARTTGPIDVPVEGDDVVVERNPARTSRSS
ncbi:general stress protein [Aquisphaera insulae]|uniref:general stress protein n=1 Tax=Aquisphaera insulae TaxID=2712864 RepID=UPI00196B04F5|nr:general stress protein [Aquisphaera insulae]